MVSKYLKSKSKYLKNHNSRKSKN